MKCILNSASYRRFERNGDLLAINREKSSSSGRYVRSCRSDLRHHLITAAEILWWRIVFTQKDKENRKYAYKLIQKTYTYNILICIFLYLPENMGKGKHSFLKVR